MELFGRNDYIKELWDMKDQNVIKVVSGVRRCGKSTLLQMFADKLIESGVAKEQIQFYNFEDPDVLFIGSWKDVYDHIKLRLIPDKKNYIFLDEVQNIDGFQRFVDGLFIKNNVDLYITGSNACLLSGELATLLTGRYIETNLFPLSFAEYYEFIAEKSPDISKNEILTKYIVEGGIPEYHKQNKIKQKQADSFVRSVLNSIIEKDIFTRQKTYNKAEFNKIVDFVFDSVGSYVSPNSIANTLKTYGTNIDRQTVSKYLDAICDSFLTYKVPRYEVKGKGLLQTLNKYYLIDPCFCKVRLSRDMRKNAGHWLENAVYFELRRRYRDVYVGKIHEKEIDFVVIDNDGYTTYYQVAWTTMSNETLERELAPLDAVKDSNPKFLLTMDTDLNPVYNGIRKINASDWFLGKY
jgi:hypothetical protein